MHVSLLKEIIVSRLMSINTLFDCMMKESQLFLEKEQDDLHKVEPHVFPFPISSEQVSWAVVGLYSQHSNGCGDAEDWTEKEFAIIMLGLIAEYIGVGQSITMSKFKKMCLCLLSYFQQDVVVTEHYIQRQKQTLLLWLRENDT